MAGKEIYKLEIKVDVDDGGVETKLSAMDKYTEKTEKRLKQLDKVKVSPSAKLDDKATSASKKVEGSLKKLDRLKTTSTADLIDKTAPKVKSATRGVQRLDKMKADPNARLKDDVSKPSEKASRSMRALDKIRAGPVAKLKDMATSASEKAKGKLQQLNKLRVGAVLFLKDELSGRLPEIKKRMNSVGKTLTKGVTAPIVGFGALSVKAVAGFDDAMSSVKAKMGENLSGKEFDQLRNKAKDLGRTTAFSASQAADAMDIIAASGADANQTLALTGNVLNLASASGLELDQTAGILTKTMAQFGLEGEKAAKMVSDQLVYAANNSQTSVEGMGEAFKYAGGNAATMNMDVAQTGAILGMFANQTIEGSAAGTAFSAMFKDLSKAGEKGALSIGKASIEVYDASGKMRDMGSIMGDVEKATEGMSDAQKNSALQAIFGQQSMRGVNALLTEGSEKYKELEKGIRKADNAAQTAAFIKEDNLAGAFRAVGSAIEGLMIDVGDVIKGPIQNIAQTIVKLAGVFGKLSEPMKKVVVIIAAVAVAIGPLLLAFAKVISIATTIGPALAGAFGAIFSPIGLVVALIVGLGAVLVGLWKTNEDFRNKVISIWNSIKDGIGSTIEAIKEFWSEHGESIMETVMNAFELIKGIIMIAMGVIATIVAVGIGLIMVAWDLFGETIVNIVTTAFDLISGVIEGAMNIVQGIITIVMAVIQGDWSAAWEGIKQIVTGAFGIITSIVSAGFSLIQGIISGAISVITSVISAGFNLVTSVVTAAVNAMKAIVLAAWNAISAAAGAVTSVVKSAWSSVTGVFDTVKSKVSSMADGVVNAWNKVKAAVSKPITGAVNFVKSGLGIGSNYKGTNNWEGGLTHIHERGGEIIDLPSGTRIYPHDKSVSMAREEGMQEASASNTTSVINRDIITKTISASNKETGINYKSEVEEPRLEPLARNVMNRNIMEDPKIDNIERVVRYGSEVEKPRLTDKVKDILKPRERLVSERERSLYSLKATPGNNKQSDIKVVVPSNNNNKGTTVIIDGVEVNIVESGNSDDESMYKIVEDAQKEFGRKLLEALKDKK